MQGRWHAIAVDQVPVRESLLQTHASARCMQVCKTSMWLQQWIAPVTAPNETKRADVTMNTDRKPCRAAPAGIKAKNAEEKGAPMFMADIGCIRQIARAISTYRTQHTPTAPMMLQGRSRGSLACRQAGVCRVSLCVCQHAMQAGQHVHCAFEHATSYMLLPFLHPQQAPCLPQVLQADCHAGHCASEIRMQQ